MPTNTMYMPGAWRAMIAEARLRAGQRVAMTSRQLREAAQAVNETNRTRPTNAAEQVAFSVQVRNAQTKLQNALDAQADALDAIVERLDALEQVAESADASGGAAYTFLGFGGQPQMVSLLNAWMAYVNKDDTVPNSTAIALAEVIEQYAVDRPEGPMLRVLATLVRAYGWYDASVGVASILQADVVDAEDDAETGSSDNLQRILDFLAGADEDEVIAAIEAAAAELGIELEEEA